MKKKLIFFLGVLLIPCLVSLRAHADDTQSGKKAIVIQAISSLLVTDPRIEGWKDSPAWEKFRQTLKKSKALGITSITVDIWWGLVQPNHSMSWTWDYYDRVLSMIADEGLEIDPILSIHKCGGNIGDDVFIPLPEWFLKLITDKGWAYKSEAGNESDEVASVWAKQAIEFYMNFWAGFRDRYSHLAHKMPKIIIGTGPAGELTYPSYHSHDRSKDYKPAHVPGRGSLQAFSQLAQLEYQNFLRVRYGTIGELNKSWKTQYNSFIEIGPLGPSKNADAFYEHKRHLAVEGQDFFAWYHGSLLNHGFHMLDAAASVFKQDVAYKNAGLSLKTPGVHWGFHDRLPQLAAGLIETHERETQWKEENGLGYGKLFTEIYEPLKKRHPEIRWEWIFTCAEMSDCWKKCYQHRPGGCEHCGHLGSAAFTLAHRLSSLADRYKVLTTIENALEGNLLFDKSAWMNMIHHWKTVPHVYSLSLLRLPHLVEDHIWVKDNGKDIKKETVSVEMLRAIQSAVSTAFASDFVKCAVELAAAK